PNRRERGPRHRRQAANGQRYSLGTAHRRALARYARTIGQLEFGLRRLHALEQAGRVGCDVRNAGESRPSRRQDAISSSAASTVSSSFVASRSATRKPPELTSRYYASQLQSSGSICQHGLKKQTTDTLSGSWPCSEWL